RYDWPDSTYVRKPPFFEGMDPEPAPVQPISGARVLAVLGDSVTTDHISPAGAIKRDSPAGRWLIEQGVEVRDFNSYGSRRGNHEVMIGMGVAPLQFADGESVESLGLNGEETFEVTDLENGDAKSVKLTATREGADPVEFEARVRLDTPNEVLYFQNGGILHRVLRDLR
ncbi:MAG: hypothetical protein ABR508_13170, partial [Candidatus Baltobacteraceae bacterium]